LLYAEKKGKLQQTKTTPSERAYGLVNGWWRENNGIVVVVKRNYNSNVMVVL